MRAELTQSIFQSPSHDNDPTYTMAVWIGTVGGGAIPTDPSPNVTPPSNGRILRISAKRNSMQLFGTGAVRTQVVPIASGSITYQVWFFDNTQNQWVQFAAPTTIAASPGGTPTTSLSMTNMAGAKVFVQITAVTNVEAFGYDWI